MEQKRQGKLDDKIFAETRLRRGVYGQRYDNGQRDDGFGSKTLEYPCGSLTKGPETVWDAPGMLRIKIPFGGVTPDSMEVLADLAEEYSDGICHITTRQDVQLHFVQLDDSPDMMRRLAAVGVTTREACGNSVRNITGCPLAGVCQDEAFDITPYSQCMAGFLLGHRDCQDFGRKFKVTFSGCAQHACGLASMHDVGFIARLRTIDGEQRRGFEVYVGGGLGAVPHQAKLFSEFIPEGEIFPLILAIARVFARLGEKKNRARARLKFVVAKLGIDEFVKCVKEELSLVSTDDRWSEWIADCHSYCDASSIEAPGVDVPQVSTSGFDRWSGTNVRRQRQEGYSVVTVALPLGDLTGEQMRRLAEIARLYVGENVRTTVEQNIILRWVKDSQLEALYADLEGIGLGLVGAESIVDVTACPGTDTCKLGIASSRGLAAELRERLAAGSAGRDEAVKGLRIKISGCFNSCGQHHLSDLGFYGVSRKFGGRAVPHFQVVLGGCWGNNANSYGLAIGAVPSRRIPEVVDRITAKYVEDKHKDESFQAYCSRVGKKNLKGMFADLMKVPGYEEDSSLYSDWRDPREFTIGDLGTGECAGEVVSLAEFDMAEAERRAFEAQILLEEGSPRKADEMAYGAMIEAARALVRSQNQYVSEDPGEIVKEFRSRFVDTEIFFDKYAGGKFAQYLLARHAEAVERSYDTESAHRLIEETLLFLEAAHACDARIVRMQAAGELLAPAAETVPARIH